MAVEISASGLARQFIDMSPDARISAVSSLTTEEMAVLEADVDALVKGNLEDWCRLALSPLGQKPAAHHKLLIRELEAIASGENDRLMVLMPPGHAKSTYTSVLFPPWFMAQAKGQSVIGASHTTDLAEYFSGRVLSTIREHGSGLGLRLLTESVGSWSTDNLGEYKAAGVGGPITGRRADLAIIDDPVKSAREADSPVVREAVWNWYQFELMTRLKPTGRIVLILTRWHEDDLAGRILESEPGKWRVVRLPAIAEEGDDPLGRSEGEALWPELWPVEKLLSRKDTVLPRVWTSLYQQRPAPAEGSLFDVTKLATYDKVPQIVRKVRAWDLAGTEDGKKKKGGGSDPDWTVGLKLGVTTQNRYVVLDVVRMRGNPAQVEQTIVDTAKADGKTCLIDIPQDPGQAGKMQVAYLGGQLAGFRVRSTPETGSKATRAEPVASQCGIGNLGMVKASWNAAFEAELRDFPYGKKDDQVDALSRAFGSLIGKAGKRARGASVAHMAR